jgi:hypothetical protein
MMAKIVAATMLISGFGSMAITPKGIAEYPNTVRRQQ